MDKICFIYNSFYRSVIEDVLATSKTSETIKERLSDALDYCREHAPTSRRYIERFIRKNGKASENVIANNNESLFDVDRVLGLELVKKVQVQDLVNAVNNKNSLACYIYLFTILAYLYDKIVYANEDDSDSSDDDADTVVVKLSIQEVELLVESTLDVLKNLQNGLQLPDDLKEKINDTSIHALLTHLSPVISTIASKPAMQDDSDMGKAAADMLENTKIGSLAKEISDELDFSSLKIEKPEDLLNMNSGENNLLTNIISKVGGKIHQKIEKGELKHEDLMQEAVSMLSMLGGKDGNAGGPAAAFMNNPMFKDVMKNMGGIGNLANIANMMKNTDKAKSSNVRDRLRRKLDKKKEQ